MVWQTQLSGILVGAAPVGTVDSISRRERMDARRRPRGSCLSAADRPEVDLCRWKVVLDGLDRFPIRWSQPAVLLIQHAKGGIGDGVNTTKLGYNKTWASRISGRP